jgi:hypothetical protein
MPHSVLHQTPVSRKDPWFVYAVKILTFLSNLYVHSFSLGLPIHALKTISTHPN